MEKTIKFGDKEYLLTSSVFTIISYQQKFNTDFYKDLQEITANTDNISSLVTILTRILYVLALPNFKETISYEQFCTEIPLDFFMDSSNLEELTDIILMLAPKAKGGQVPQVKR